jgi:catechol 2,3-dioxygenase-like lactoylglutathione lyase family enzyme
MEGIEVHIGVDAEFRPARKAHPAFLVTNLDELARRLERAGVRVNRDARFPGMRRFYSEDPFGNRLEFLEPAGRLEAQ